MIIHIGFAVVIDDESPQAPKADPLGRSFVFAKIMSKSNYECGWNYFVDNH